MRMAAAILTRAACLLASDGRLKSGSLARHFTMSGLIRAVRKELFPDARKRVPDGEPDESAWAWAYALIPQDPIDKSPEPRALVNAVRKLREWARLEDAIESRTRWTLPADAAESLRAAIASTPVDHPDHGALMSSRFMRKGAA
jgi:hypothetical protein